MRDSFLLDRHLSEMEDMETLRDIYDDEYLPQARKLIGDNLEALNTANDPSTLEEWVSEYVLSFGDFVEVYIDFGSEAPLEQLEALVSTLI